MMSLQLLQSCVLLLAVGWSVNSESGGVNRATLLEHSPLLEVIPDRFFELPLGTGTTSNNNNSGQLKSQTWSLLEPRDLDENSRIPSPSPSRPVRYTGEKICEGACITSRNCDYHHGHVLGQCSNGNVCCVFQKSCGGVSREKVSFFQSPSYPSSTNQSMECSYRIHPNENTCALRIDFERFELRRAKRYSKVEKCIDDIMFILNSANGAAEGVCEMENHTAIVEVDPKSSHPIIILFVAQSENVSWSLKITQINCKKQQPSWTNDPNCGRQLMYEPNEYDSDSQSEALENSEYSSLSGKQGKEPRLPQPEPYIVNGKDAELREFPWQVSLQLKAKSSHRCGGTILNDRYILTAAHCVFRNAFISKARLKVAVGDYILGSEEDGRADEFDIEKVIVHFSYKPSQSHVNDIAVIKLNGTIKFNEKVQPVCLPDKDVEVFNKNAIVSGWGWLNGTDSTATASTLQKLDVKIIPNDECKEIVKNEYEEILQKNLTYEDISRASLMGTTELQLCGMTKKNSSACFGDSGGPLVMQNEDNGRYFQVGVVSYGLGRCRIDRDIPGSYTNVKKYLNFIAIATMEP